MSPYCVDVCACDDMFFHLPGPRSSLAKTVTLAVSHGLCKWDRVNYHWRDLPQVSFLLWQKFCRESMLAMTELLLWQIYVCRNKILLAWQKFCHDRYLVQQTHVCCDKSFGATKMILVGSSCQLYLCLLISFELYFCTPFFSFFF